MDWGKVVYVFFALMSITSIAGFLYDTKSEVMLFFALSVNLISTILKIGVKNLLAAEIFAASLVADLHLIPAWVYYDFYNNINTAVSLSIGALIANIISLVFVVVELIKSKEDY